MSVVWGCLRNDGTAGYVGHARCRLTFKRLAALRHRIRDGVDIRSQPVLRVAAGATALASRGVDETVGLTAAAFDVGS